MTLKRYFTYLLTYIKINVDRYHAGHQLEKKTITRIIMQYMRGRGADATDHIQRDDTPSSSAKAAQNTTLK